MVKPFLGTQEQVLTMYENSRTGVDHDVCDQKSLSHILEAYITEVIEYVRKV